jgi:16S rRNA (cytosine1402-N4)-methyltransferase
MFHAPVLCEEAVAFLNISGSRTYVDGTVGGGGHAAVICGRLAGGGRLICVDRDEQAVAAARARLAAYAASVSFVHAPFGTLPDRLAALGIGRIAGLLLDLGVSSHQLDDGARGFTFRADAPLDMRMDARQGVSALEVVNGYTPEHLADILWRYGEERFSRRIARRICERRPVRTTGELREAVSSVIGGAHAVKSLARVFQAIRIEVNGELDQLERLLAATPAMLEEGGRLVVITYHSLEDRIVKDFMRRESTPAPGQAFLPVVAGPVRFRQVTKKAVVPAAGEVERNPRARSAKMRVAERTDFEQPRG